MEDDKIKELLKAYNPDLGSDFKFMASLERKMEAVEHVKQEMRELRRRNRIAVAVAAAAGFGMGTLTTLLAPAITSLISVESFSLYRGGPSIGLNIIVYIAASILAIAAAFNAYEITIARLSRQNL